MGCFSFKCLECGRGVLSSSFHGDHVHLFLLDKGKIIQKMTGEYDSYGTVFIDGTQYPSVEHDLRLSEHWKDPTPEIPLDVEKVKIIGEEHSIWHRVTDLMHDKDDFTSGIAAIHVKCYKKDPVHRSPPDPNQGWGPKGKKVKNYDPLKELKIESLRDKMWRVKDSMTFSGLMLVTSKPGDRFYELKKQEYDTYKAKYKAMETEYLDLGGKKSKWMVDV